MEHTRRKKDITGCGYSKRKALAKDQNCGLNKFGFWSFAGINNNKVAANLEIRIEISYSVIGTPLSFVRWNSRDFNDNASRRVDP